MKLLVIVTLLFGFCMRVSAATQLSQQKILSTQKPAEKKKIGVDQSDFMPAASSYGAIVSYGASYNQIEQVREETVRHRISAAITYSFDKDWSVYGAVAAAHESYGNKIYRENDTDPYHELSNLNVGAVYNQMSPLRYISRSSNTINLALPVSRESRVDGHVVSVSATNFMQTYSWYDFSIFNRLNADFLGNTQKFSLFNGDTLNRDWLLSNSFGITYMILKNVGARYSVRIDSVRYLDQSWDLSFGNNVSIFANISGFQIFASFINNSYPENERVDISFYDKYRKIYSAGVVYAF